MALKHNPVFLEYFLYIFYNIKALKYVEYFWSILRTYSMTFKLSSPLTASHARCTVSSFGSRAIATPITLDGQSPTSSTSTSTSRNYFHFVVGCIFVFFVNEPRSWEGRRPQLALPGFHFKGLRPNAESGASGSIRGEQKNTFHHHQQHFRK